MTAEPWPLPPSWRWARFDEVAKVASNLLEPTQHPDFPHIAPNHIESETGRLLPYSTVAADGVTSAKHGFRAGQVLYSKIRPYLAKVVVAEFEGLCSADMYPIDTDLEPRYLKWWMLTREFTRLAAGEQARTVLPKINVRSLNALPVPVAPAKTQGRIVEILEDHLSRLDAAGAYLATAKSGVTSVRRAWLYQKLGNPRREELRNLSDVLTEGRGGWSRGRRHVTDVAGGIPYLKMNNIAPDGRLDLSATTFVTGESEERARFEVRPGDLLFNSKNSGDLVGKAAMADERVAGWTFNENIMRLRFSSALDPRFVWLWFQGPVMRHAIRAGTAATTNVAAIYMHQLRGAPVWVPDIRVQQQLVEEYMALDDAGRRIGTHVATAKVRGKVLRAALLASAFAGRLSGQSARVEGGQ